MEISSSNFFLLPNLYLNDENIWTKQNRLVLLSDHRNFYYKSAYYTYTYKGLNFFINLPGRSKRNLSFLFLIRYFNFFFKNAALWLKKNTEKFKVFLLCLLKKSSYVLKYVSKKFNCYYLSSFLPQTLTNSQYKLTYSYNLSYNFDFYFKKKSAGICLFFFSSPFDPYMIKAVLSLNLLVFSFTTHNKFIEISDFFFPYEIFTDRDIYLGTFYFFTIFDYLNCKKF